MPKVKVAVLVSGGGSNLQALMDADQDVYEIVLVISNRRKAYGLERARMAGIPTAYFGKGNFPDQEERFEAMQDLIESKGIDLIVLAGYLSILPAKIVTDYEKRIINIHPSLIPQYCGEGFYGHRVHDAVIQAGEKESGATTHFVDSGVDTGEIIMQKRVPVLDGDTSETLASRVLEVEHQIIVETVKTVSLQLLKEDKSN